MSPWLHLRCIPFIAASRDNDQLFQRLRQDDAPILIEGIHGCELLRRIRKEEQNGLLRHRTVVVRAHNVEADYYHLLARSERKLFRKFYLSLEAIKLHHYEPVLKQANAVLAITDADAAVFRQMGCVHVLTVPPFMPPIERDNTLLGCQYVCSHKIPNPYVLFHADLSVPDNEWAVRWLQKNVLSRVDYPFVVAGRNPRPALCRYLSHFPCTELIKSPSQQVMDRLIEEARCTVMITRQPTGFKLKLINSLVLGQHCLVNNAMVSGTGLDGFCHIADDADAIRSQLDRLMQTPFSELQQRQRLEMLAECFDETVYIEQIISVL